MAEERESGHAGKKFAEQIFEKVTGPMRERFDTMMGERRAESAKFWSQPIPSSVHGGASRVGGFMGDVVSGIFQGTRGLRGFSGGMPDPLSNYAGAAGWGMNTLRGFGSVQATTTNLTSPLATAAVDVAGLASGAVIDLFHGSNSQLGKLGAGISLAGFGLKLGGAAVRSMESSREESVGNPYLSPSARRNAAEQRRFEESTSGLAFSLNRLGRRQGKGLTVRYGKRDQYAMQMTGYPQPF